MLGRQPLEAVCQLSSDPLPWPWPRSMRLCTHLKNTISSQFDLTAQQIIASECVKSDRVLMEVFVVDVVRKRWPIGDLPSFFHLSQLCSETCECQWSANNAPSMNPTQASFRLTLFPHLWFVWCRDVTALLLDPIRCLIFAFYASEMGKAKHSKKSSEALKGATAKLGKSKNKSGGNYKKVRRTSEFGGGRANLQSRIRNTPLSWRFSRSAT